MKIVASSSKVMNLVQQLLDEEKMSYKKLNETELIVQFASNECKMRVMMQKHLEKCKMNFRNDFVLIDGNSVWSKKLIMSDIRKIKKKNSTDGISTYFYKFMHLNFTIAHYNISGWISEYPTGKEVLSVIENSSVPSWKCDVQAIVDEIKEIL